MFKNVCKILVLVWCYVVDFRPGVPKLLEQTKSGYLWESGYTAICNT
jgi:hypothetical protein